MKREDKLVKNTAILTIGTAFSSLFSFFLIPVFSRWLSTSDYGTYDVYLTYITLLIPLATLSCGEAAFRFLLDCKTDEEKKRILNCTWFIAILGTLLGIVIIIIVFSLGKFEQLIPFIVLFLSFMLYNQGNYITRGFRRLSVYTIANIVYLVFMMISVTCLVFFCGFGLAGILYGNAIGHFTGFIYMFISCKMWKYTVIQKPKWEEIKRVSSYSAPLMPNSISWWIVNVSDRSIINIILGASFNGIYAIAYKLPSLCSTVFGVFHMSWIESAVDSINDDDRNRYTNNIFNGIIPFCFSIAGGVLACNRYFYKWIWDEKYIDGSVLVWILLGGMCFSFLSQFLGGILIAEKKTRANGITTIVAAVINIIIHIVFIKAIGLYAAAISTLVAYVSLFIIRFILLRKTYQLKINMKSYISVLTFIAIVIMQYFSSEIIGIIEVMFSVICFIMLNRKILIQLLNKFLVRR